MRQLIAAGRLAATAAMFLAMGIVTPLQAFIIGPVFKNYETVPTLFYKAMCALYGIRVRFAKASAPIENDRQTWYVANHMSIADFAVLGSFLKGTFAGRGDLLEWPAVSQMARAIKYIGLKRASKKDAPEVYQKNMLKARSKIISEFETGRNMIMFPEGTTTEGKEVAMFRAGLIKLIFGEAGLSKAGQPITLSRPVVVQPLAIHVVKVGGKNAVGNDALRNTYSLPGNEVLPFIWKRAMAPSTEIELTAFPALDPKDFNSAEDLINEAHRLVRGVVAPHQNEVKKAVIPGMDDAGAPKKEQAAQNGNPRL